MELSNEVAAELAGSQDRMLREANEEPWRFRITSPYRVIEVRRPQAPPARSAP